MPRLAAQARSQIDHAADGRIIPASLEAERAERGVTVRDADAEIEIVAELHPALAQRRERGLHLERRKGGARRRIRKRQGIVEENQDAVSGEAVDGAFVAGDDRAHRRVVFAERVP